MDCDNDGDNDDGPAQVAAEMSFAYDFHTQFTQPATLPIAPLATTATASTPHPTSTVLPHHHYERPVEASDRGSHVHQGHNSDPIKSTPIADATTYSTPRTAGTSKGQQGTPYVITTDSTHPLITTPPITDLTAWQVTWSIKAQRHFYYNTVTRVGQFAVPVEFAGIPIEDYVCKNALASTGVDERVKKGYTQPQAIPIAADQHSSGFLRHPASSTVPPPSTVVPQSYSQAAVSQVPPSYGLPTATTTAIAYAPYTLPSYLRLYGAGLSQPATDPENRGHLVTIGVASAQHLNINKSDTIPTSSTANVTATAPTPALAAESDHLILSGVCEEDCTNSSSTNDSATDSSSHHIDISLDSLLYSQQSQSDQLIPCSEDRHCYSDEDPDQYTQPQSSPPPSPSLAYSQQHSQQQSRDKEYKGPLKLSLNDEEHQPQSQLSQQQKKRQGDEHQSLSQQHQQEAQDEVVKDEADKKGDVYNSNDYFHEWNDDDDEGTNDNNSNKIRPSSQKSTFGLSQPLTVDISSDSSYDQIDYKGNDNTNNNDDDEVQLVDSTTTPGTSTNIAVVTPGTHTTHSHSGSSSKTGSQNQTTDNNTNTTTTNSTDKNSNNNITWLCDMCTYKNVGKTCICELCGYNRITCMANESQLSQQQLVLHTPSSSSNTHTTTSIHTNTHTNNTRSNTNTQTEGRKNAYSMLLQDSTKGNNNNNNNNNKGNTNKNPSSSVTAVKPNTRLSKNKGKK